MESLKRLTRELQLFQQDPPPFIAASPLPSDLHEWHFVLRGPPGTPFAGGAYHGKLLFPAGYPYEPPTIVMLTPNGRFDVNTPICTSMSSFHPESWSPMWRVSSILTGFLSFMLEGEQTVGCVHTTAQQKRELASASLQHLSGSELAQSLWRTLEPNNGGSEPPGID